MSTPAANHDCFVVVRTADGWLAVDVGDPLAHVGLSNALGIKQFADDQEPVAEVGTTAQIHAAAIERVTQRWTTAEVLLALDQEDVRARRLSDVPSSQTSPSDASSRHSW